MEQKVVSLPLELVRMREADRLIRSWCEIEAKEFGGAYLSRMRYLEKLLKDFSVRYYPDLY